MTRRVDRIGRARRLRRNMTDAERRLWRALRRRQIDGFQFRRQHPIGQYVVDFVCMAAKLVVEVDGGQHADQTDSDAERTRRLADRGYHVVTFWNHDVLRQPEAVAEEIRRALRECGSGRTPS